MNTVNVPVELARDIASEMVGSEFEEGGHTFKVVASEQIESRRWVSVHEVVVKIDDKFFQTCYERGLTEYQDQAPFEDYDDVVPFHRVMPREKTVIEYIPFVESE